MNERSEMWTERLDAIVAQRLSPDLAARVLARADALSAPPSHWRALVIGAAASLLVCSVGAVSFSQTHQEVVASAATVRAWQTWVASAGRIDLP